MMNSSIVPKKDSRSAKSAGQKGTFVYMLNPGLPSPFSLIHKPIGASLQEATATTTVLGDVYLDVIATGDSTDALPQTAEVDGILAAARA